MASPATLKRRDWAQEQQAKLRGRWFRKNMPRLQPMEKGNEDERQTK